MAEKIIKNPSLLPSDLAFELSGNTITAISGHPIAGSGGGTQSDYVYYPDFDETTGNIEFKLGTIDYPPSPIGGWHISGADGARGPQGEPGVNGKTPTFQINPENAHWEWKYTDAVTWIDTQVVASGAVGPKGQDGTNGTNGTNGKDGKDGTDGKDGVSPTVSTSVIDGGNRVTFTYGEGSSTYIDVMSGTPGTPGTPGTDGFSPTVTTSEILPTTQHPQGGTSVTITDSVGAHQFDVWNGLNGEGATVNLLEGTGIQITENGTDYTIGVSADYALKSELPDVTDMATKTWVGDQGYLKAVPDITANNGLSATGHTVGISNTGIDANKQYAWTTNGWEEVVDYLPTSGGTVSGQLVVSGGGNFDQQFLKITRENVNGYGRIGLGSSGPLAFKVDDASSHTTQINISPNTTNDQLVQVQHNSNTIGYLIPAIIEQAGWTPSTDDKILHIVLESE